MAQIGIHERRLGGCNRLVVALAVGQLAGCGSESESGPLELRLRATTESALTEVTVVATLADGSAATVACPGGSAGALSCTADGVRVDHPSDPCEVTVKARGHRFVTRSLKLDELPFKGGAHVAELPLDALAAFSQSADYATGFGAGEGPRRFEELAVAADGELGPSELVKFYIHDVSGKPEVYFQNTKLHPLHYTFARDVVGVPKTLTEFEASTYHGEDRADMAGTLAFYPRVSAASEALGGEVVAPVALTFFPSDDLTPAQAALAHRYIEERLGFASLGGREQRLVYVPAGTVQEDALAGAKDLFARRGVPWLTRRELYGNLKSQVLNDGLAYGTLRVMSPEELQTSVVSFTDVLVLTRLPNWLPVVGGTITAELQTPLAHVNIAARTRGTPNMALLEAAGSPEIAPLIGKLVRFEVKDGGYSLEATTLEEAQAFWESRHREPMTPAHDDTLADLPALDAVGFADAIRIGVKAANAAELHQLLGPKAPDGFAVPFHYYDAFMSSAAVSAAGCDAAEADCLDEGRDAALCDRAATLCAAGSEPEVLFGYVARLLADPGFTADASLREAALDGLRYHIKHLPMDPGFAAALDARVAELCGNVKVRLRSSTNAEDLPNFSGAGLYDSVSAYATGSDAASAEIRKIWASVWNFRAHEERSFWNIDHLAVRMGVLVHPAFSEEAANGVLITQNIADRSTEGMYANVQLGEESVTNPESGALPEIFSIIPAPSGVQVARLRYSSLSADVPILSQQEISTLYQTAYKVQQRFADLYGKNPASLALDLEFKFNEPDRSLVVKQARPYTAAAESL